MVVNPYSKSSYYSAVLISHKGANFLVNLIWLVHINIPYTSLTGKYTFIGKEMKMGDKPINFAKARMVSNKKDKIFLKISWECDKEMFWIRIFNKN